MSTGGLLMHAGLYWMLLLFNSPGHRPRACQSIGNNPQSWLLFPLGTGLQLLLESRRIRFIVSLGGGSGLQVCAVNEWNPTFRPFKNHSRNRSRLSSILEAKMLPKSIPKPFKIHSRSHPETKPPKTTKAYRTKPLQTLKIELSCRRGARFHYFTVFTNRTKSYPKTREKYSEIL